MNILVLIILIISIIFNIILGIYFKKTFFNIIPKYEEFILKMKKEFEEGYQVLKSVDLKKSFSDPSGALENDDEIGLIYNKIKTIIEKLNKFLNG